ncbi:MAG: M48 family metalloprotease [Bryobacteraceae bacterium]
MARRLLLWPVVFMLSGSAFAQLKEYKPGFNLFSKEQDIQLGKESAAQVEQQMQVINDPKLQAFIDRIGKRLASQQQAGGFPYTFKVVSDPSINAFALPGGPTFVNTGLIVAADNEDQLAAVMAHEISHVSLRHGTNQASKANFIQLPAMLAGAVMGNSSLLGQLTSAGIGLGANSVLLKFSRGAETQADLNGAQLMASAGYNPIEMARFFEKLEASGGKAGPQFLSDHPNPGNRMKAIQDEIRYMPRKDYTAGANSNFREIQAIVKALPPAKPKVIPNALTTSADSIPSGQFKDFKGKSFSLSYPDNWEVFGDKNSNAVTIAPRSGMAQDSSGKVQIGYGMMASYYIPQGRDRVDLNQDTAGLLQQLRQSNPGLEVAQQKAKLIKVGGQDALVTAMTSQSPLKGETEHDTLVTVARPDGLLYLILIAPGKDEQKLQPAFDNMIRTLRF